MSDLVSRLQDLSPERLRLLARQLKGRSAAQKAASAPPPTADAATGAFPSAELIPEELDQVLAEHGGREAVEDLYPLSPLQEGMLFHALHAPEQAAYHDHITCRLVTRGDFDADVFRRAFGRVVARHPILRTGFVWTLRGRPHQIVLRRAEVPVEELDWCALSPGEQREQLDAFLAADRQRPYDLSRPPLMRPTLVRLSAVSWRLIFSSHHIVMDAWSEMLILSDLVRFYSAFCRGLEAKLPPARPYRAYIDWLRQQDTLQAEAAWRRSVGGFLTPTPLAPDRPQAAGGAAGEGGDCSRELSEAVTAALQTFARRHRLTLHTLLQSAWALLLERLSGERDVLFGTVVSGRPHDLAGVESIVGLLANTVPVRILTPQDETVLPWLQEVQACQLELRPHQWTPLLRVQSWSEVPQGEPLFESALVLVSTPGTGSRPAPESELEAHPEQYDPRTNLSLTLMVWPGASLLCRLFYDRRRFDPTTVQRRMALFEDLLTSLTTAHGGRLGEIPSLTRAERHQTLVEWNDAEIGPVRATFLELFTAQARHTPDRVAATCAGRAWTYRQLAQDGQRIAGLLAGMQAGPETVVAVLAERGTELLATLLAIFGAGGVYLPLDPRSPEDRLVQVLERSRAFLVIAAGSFLPGLRAALAHASTAGSIRLLALEDLLDHPLPVENPAAPSGPGHLAYVMYTSGSTGVPKGVMVEQRGMLNHLWAKIRALDLTGADIVAQTASQCFDISVWQFLAALLVGGRVEICDDEIARDTVGLLDHLESREVTVVETVPSLLRALVEEIERRGAARPRLSSFAWMIPTGEALPPDLCRSWLACYPQVPLLNAYGPTECSDDVTHHRIARPPVADEICAPIGRPVDNMRLFLLDRDLRPMPIGAAGEICIAGVGVGRGYLDDPARTAEVFVPDLFPRTPGDRMYRTGDLGRHLPDGEIAFLGRVDHQVKIRGFRIETGEIEALLHRHPAVQSAVVVPRQAADGRGDLHLIAYVVPRHAAEIPSLADLADAWRSHLRKKLPDYMVPAAFVLLESLPLNRHGKIDRKALPAPDASGTARKEGRVGAGNLVEELLQGMWCQILGVERIELDQPFFDAGGHSLLAIQLVSRIRATFQVELPLRSFFESPTVAQLARTIEAALKRSDLAAAPPLVRRSRAGRLPLSYAQQRLWIVDQLTPNSPAYNLPVGLRLHGEIDRAALDYALSEIVRRHECLSTTFALEEDQPVQVLHPPSPFRFPVVDLTRLPPPRREDETLRLTMQEVQTGFDLACGPLLRGRLLRLEREHHVMLLTLHHIVSDGWSMGVLIHEVVTLYRAFVAGGVSPLPGLIVQAEDFAAWQREWLQGEVLEEHLGYWRRQLAGELPVLRLPFARPRPARPTHRGSRRSFVLPAELSASLQALSRRQGVTLFMTLLAALKALLHRYSGQEDLIVGAEVANRTRVEIEPLIGFFVNMLPLRTDLGGNPTFLDLLTRVREVSLAGYTHQDLPFDRLVEEIQPERRGGQTTLLQVVFVLENAPTHTLEVPGLAVEGYPLDNGTSKFELLLMMYETSALIGGTWTFDADLFDDAAAARVQTDYVSLLSQIAHDPTVRLNRLELRTADEPGRQANMLRKESRRKGLLDFQPRAIDVSGENLIRTSLLSPGSKLPLLVEPAAEGVDLIDWARSHNSFVESRLLEHGAILFRGFDIPSATHFEQFCLAFCPELYGEYGDLPRGNVGGRIYESTPYPPDRPILMHNESSQMHCWPLKQWFFCVQPAQAGGETPVADGRRIYQLLDPAIRDRFAQRRLMYVRNFSRDLDVSWQDFFHTEDRAEVERYCQQASIQVEWRDDGDLRTRMINPAVARHPKSGEMVFFNQIQAHHISCLEPEVRESLLSLFRMEDLPRNVYYGDGSPIEDSLVQEIRALYDEVAVAFPWQKGEILMVDNMLVSHSRNPYTGPRKIVVAMGEMIRSRDVATA